jgi:hypothetical protein
LDAISDDLVVEHGEQFGRGASGDVHSTTIPGLGEFARKTGNIDNEADIGQDIMDIGQNVTSSTQINRWIFNPRKGSR